MTVNRTGVPRFPEPGRQYTPEYMHQFIRALVLWMNALLTPSDAEVSETAITTVTDSGLVGYADGVLLADTTSNAIVLTLPDAAAVTGRQFTVKRISGGTNGLTVITAAGNIDGASSKSIPTQYLSHTFKSDGTDYWIM